jgi:hypothetical protein
MLLIKTPRTFISSRMPREHPRPFGSLALGGPLIGTGHQAKSLDASGRTDTNQAISKLTLEESRGAVEVIRTKNVFPDRNL